MRTKAEREWIAKFGDKERAELDRSHVVLCEVATGGRYMLRGEELLREIERTGATEEVRIATITVPTDDVAEALRLVLAQRPSPRRQTDLLH
ncbi:hypothetical protein [Paracraurococcus lichenis]|uniref:Uncharacterized protein n=1 Tax=Paracraurococcus lichenis TaxID=3064888 RepID=A0ABT9EED7_9PROT|nr:hypothetical protein [Paracraurococcus sp. LOR1-02]MDO9714353.1 hypothetical protein [Paracraurococcus sp. LOR1-02]